MKIGLIICTKDRPIDLGTLFGSIEKQTRRPDQVIVVDGSDTPIRHVLDRFVATVPVDYLTVRPPGLAKQRNVGIKQLNSAMDWVGFLDDDLVLEENCLEELEIFLKARQHLKGVGLVINNQIMVKPHFYRTLFMMDKGQGGLLTKSGVPSAIRPVQDDLKVEWLYGGATFWCTSVFEEFNFDEWFSGVGYMEDVDFSYRVSRKYSLMLSSKSRCYHYHHPIRKERLLAHGAWHFVAWWYFATKYKFNKVLVLWSMLGVLISNLGVGLFRPHTNRLFTTMGNLQAFRVIFRGQVMEFKGFQK